MSTVFAAAVSTDLLAADQPQAPAEFCAALRTIDHYITRARLGQAS